MMITSILVELYMIDTNECTTDITAKKEHR